MRALPSPLLVVTDRFLIPPPFAGEGGPRVSEGRERGAPPSPDTSRSPLPPRIREAPSPAEGGGDGRAIDARHQFIATIDAILDAGARWFWFRERDMEVASRRSLAIAVMARVHAKGGTFSLGGDAALAAEIGADGAHLPGGTNGEAIPRARDVLRAGLVGVSAHTLREVEDAAVAGADYVTLSPIFATASKPGYGPALGTEALRAASTFGTPVIALGGITPINSNACRDAGAAGIAVMGGVMRSPVPEQAAAAFLAAWAQRPDGP